MKKRIDSSATAVRYVLFFSASVATGCDSDPDSPTQATVLNVMAAVKQGEVLYQAQPEADSSV